MARCLSTLLERQKSELVLLGTESNSGGTRLAEKRLDITGDRKVGVLRNLPSTDILPLVKEIKSFACPDGALASSLMMRRWRCTRVYPKGTALQWCYDCHDRSDEAGCTGVERLARQCRHLATPNHAFFHSGTMGSNTTAVLSWTHSSHGHRLELADATWIHSAWEGVSYPCSSASMRACAPQIAPRVFCGRKIHTYHTGACASSPLNLSSDYTTYRFNEVEGHGRLSVGPNREYLGEAHAGTCGPTCAQPKMDEDLQRSRCHRSGSLSGPGIAHCASPPTSTLITFSAVIATSGRLLSPRLP